jgi:hypothetical protein
MTHLTPFIPSPFHGEGNPEVNEGFPLSIKDGEGDKGGEE